jgi:hypothetical protein
VNYALAIVVATGVSATATYARVVVMPIHSSTAVQRIVVTKDAVSLADAIERACADPDSYEADEPLTTPKAKRDLKALLEAAEEQMDEAMPLGDIAPYFGELSITWRHQDHMLRATSFSDDRTPRLDYGSTPHGELGQFNFQLNATGDQLRDRLQWLFANA